MRRPAKYGNRRVEVDGITFASAKEAKRYGELRLLERAGEIAGLEVHPKYILSVGGIKLGTYSPDFRYLSRSGVQVVEDVKGGPTDTQLFRWKARHLRAEHGIAVEIVR